MTSVQEFIKNTHKKRPIILDGGTGRELERVGAPFRSPEWSALSLMEAPETVKKVHDSFIQAGSDIITVNSYAVVPFHIGEEKFEKDGKSLLQLAGTLAQDSAKSASKPVFVAGCIPPVLGSYKTEVDDKEKAEKLTDILIENQEDYADLWLCETMSSYEDGDIAFNAIKRSGSRKPTFYSFVIERNDTGKITLRSGEDIEESLKNFADKTKADAILFNCSEFVDMEDAIKTARASLGDEIFIGVYPNRFSKIKKDIAVNSEHSTIRDDLTAEYFKDLSKVWYDTGATMVGGCCGVGADFIEVMAADWINQKI